MNGEKPLVTRALIDAVRDSARIDEVVGMRVALRAKGRNYWGLCPFHDDRNPSMQVRPDRGHYKCFSCGAGGDVIDFVMRAEGLGFSDAILRLAGYYGLSDGRGQRGARPVSKGAPRKTDAAAREEDHASDRNAVARALKILMQSIPARGTVVEAYYRARGIDTDILPEGVLTQLRFVDRLPYWHEGSGAGGGLRVLGEFPAAVAPMQDRRGRIRAAHITWLNPDGSGKASIPDPDQPGAFLSAKKMRGRPWGCAVRLGPAMPGMMLSEGIENGLSALVARPHESVWVAGSLGNIAGAGRGEGAPHPNKPGRKLPSERPDFSRPGVMMPPECERLIILGERDARDQASVDAQIARAAQRFAAADIRVFVAWSPEGCDHNDVLRQTPPDLSRQTPQGAGA